MEKNAKAVVAEKWINKGTRVITFGEVRFVPTVPVEVTDATLIARLKANKNFKVTEAE